MNQIATPTQGSAPRIPRIVAQLDLANDDQRRLHALITRMHSGRWPLFRMLAMRQIGRELHEAVQWRGARPDRYAVVTWRSDGLGLSWQSASSAREARRMLASLNSPQPSAVP